MCCDCHNIQRARLLADVGLHQCPEIIGQVDVGLVERIDDARLKLRGRLARLPLKVEGQRGRLGVAEQDLSDLN